MLTFASFWYEIEAVTVPVLLHTSLGMIEDGRIIGQMIMPVGEGYLASLFHHIQMPHEVHICGGKRGRSTGLELGGVIHQIMVGKFHVTCVILMRPRSAW